MKLTEGEKHFINRRRLGINQADMASFYGVCESVYNRWELGKIEPKQNITKIRGLNDYEYCGVLRRRKGMTQTQVASKIGCTRVWVNRMELGKENWGKLKEYWDNAE